MGKREKESGEVEGKVNVISSNDVIVFFLYIYIYIIHYLPLLKAIFLAINLSVGDTMILQL